MAKPTNDEERDALIDQAGDLISQAQALLIEAGARRAPKLIAHFKRVVEAEKQRPMFPQGNVDPFNNRLSRQPLHVRREQE